MLALAGGSLGDGKDENAAPRSVTVQQTVTETLPQVTPEPAVAGAARRAS